MQYLPFMELCSRDLTTVKIRLCSGEVEGDLIVSSVYLPYDAENPLPSRELDTSVGRQQSGQHLLLRCVVTLIMKQRVAVTLTLNVSHC